MDCTADILCFRRTLNNSEATVIINSSAIAVELDILVLGSIIFSTSDIPSNMIPTGQSVVLIRNL